MVNVISDKKGFHEFIEATKKSKLIGLVHFFAPWAASSVQLDELLFEYKKEYEGLEVAKVDAEGLPEISLENGVSAVPTIVVFKNGKRTGKIEGFHPAELRDLITKVSFDISTQNTVDVDKKETSKENLDERLIRLINTSRLTLFMKGNADSPKCGFSRQIVDLLRQNNADFWTFDILCDEEVRQGLKKYSDWPTYPQLYLDGELLGGLDVVREEMNDPTFVEKLPKKSN